MTIKHLFPPSKPTLDLNFAAERALDPRITFTRSSIGTYVDSRGIIQTAADDEPRFDHDPETGESLGLLIEESRTNSQLYSSDFTDSVWVKSELTVTPNAVTAPDGTLTASKLVEANSVGGHYIEGNPSATDGTTWTFSVFAKAAERTELLIWLRSEPGALEYFDLSSGTKISDNLGSNSRITPFANGWYRISITDIVSSNRKPYIATAVNGSNSTNGDGVSGIFVWGAQLEEGSFPTSYIPTSGSIEPRAADIASITGTNFSSWYNQSEGTIYAKFAGQTYATGNTSRILSFADNNSTTMSGDTGILFGSHTGGPDEQRWRVRGPSTTSFAIATEPVVSTALAYATSDLAMVFDGGTVESSTNSPPTALDRLNIFPANVPICRLAYYPRRLTDEQLEALTS